MCWGLLALLAKSLVQRAYRLAAVVDKLGAYLHECSSRIEHILHILIGRYATTANNGVGALRTGVDAAYNLQSTLFQRMSVYRAGCATQLVHLLGRVFQTVASRRARYGHDAVQRRFKHNVGHHINLLVTHIGRYFQQYGAILILTSAELKQWLQDSHNLCLVGGDITLCCRVATDIYREVINILIQRTEQSQIISRSLVVGRCESLDNIAAHHHTASVAFDILDDLLHAGKATIQVLSSADKWHGVTYAADKPGVVAALKEKTEQGLYPNGLWK